MGAVWLAEHLTLRSHVAIKLIHLDMAGSTEALARFLREAQSAASLRSPHVVQILDHGVDNGTPYIAMELLEGESLADRLARVGRLEPAELARIMTQVGRAIARAHEAHIVHRDLKPDNVFLVRNDDEEMAKVLDFGIAKSAAQGGLTAAVSSSTRTGAVLGTPYYMSPEQAEGAKSLDYRSDIWAMGVIAFECLLGRKPFDAETLGALLLAICARPIAVPSHYGAVPAGFDEWFARACARDLGARFGSAREAAAELKRVCENSASPPSSLAPPSLPVSRTVALPVEVGAPLANQSVAGLSASRLETGRTAARGSRAAPYVAIGVIVCALGGGIAAWSHFKAQPPQAEIDAGAPTLVPAPTHVAAQASVVPEPAATTAPSVSASAEAPLPQTPAALKHGISAAKSAAGQSAPMKPAAVKAAPGGVTQVPRAAEAPAVKAAPAAPDDLGL